MTRNKPRPKTRKFNGKIYKYWGNYVSRESMEVERRRSKRKGYSIRLVKYKSGPKYTLYARKK